MRRKSLILFISFILLLLAAVLYFTRLPGGEKIRLKRDLISAKFEEKGFRGGYIIISEKRHKWYNKLLANSIDKSSHLKGMAMDFWVMDLNDDGKWDKQDIDFMVAVIGQVEDEHPELAGWIGTYPDKGLLASRMVHTDVSGIRNK
jgi:hypothetical protein